MLPLDCPFCAHKNPAGAKFCNECGSPLNLATCTRCGAVNNESDPECQRCGATLLRPDAPADPVDREAEFGGPEWGPSALEQELGAIEQGLRELAQKADHPTLPPKSAPPQFAAPETGHQRESGEKRESSARPAKSVAPRFDPTVVARQSSWYELITIVIFVAVMAAGGYFYYWLGASPPREPFITAPRDAPAEPRVPNKAAGVVEPAPATATPPAPQGVAAPKSANGG